MDRLEFREFKNIPNFRDSEYWIPLDSVQPTITQLFISRIKRPGEGPIRLILKMGTGTGKSLSSLQVAKSYIKVYSNYYSYGIGDRNVIILGFSSAIFKRELLKYPELGIITPNEHYYLNVEWPRLIRESSSSVEIAAIEAKMKNLKANIKKSISRKSEGGFYKFFGYKQLFNQLFKGNFPPTITSGNIYNEYLAGNVLVDMNVLNLFREGLIIADEIHQVYNSTEANNYGLAIQFILDYLKNEVSILLLSATIINNNKRELIDIANLIKDPEVPHFKSDDYFFANSNKTKKGLEPIYQQFAGKVVFLEEQTEDYPEIKYQIKEIVKPSISHRIKMAYGGLNVDDNFLQLTESMLTPLQNATFLDNNFFDPEVKTKFNMIHDLIVPNPDYPAEEILKYHPDHPDHKNRIPMTGLFDTAEIRDKIYYAPEEWKKKIGIEIRLERDYHILSGSWLKYENLKIYSGKGVTLIDTIRQEMKKDPRSKFLIYHPYVKDSGILTITEILRQNGFITVGEQPNSETYSSSSTETLADFRARKDKTYRPANITTISYEVKDNNMNNIIDSFNDPANKYGESIKILIGAKKISQSVDFKDVQVEIIYSAPTNMSEFIQIKGRAVRNGSLSRLPPDKRQVRLYTFCGVSKHGLTFEAQKYIKKIMKFKEIQKIEYNINKAAINNYIYESKKFSSTDALGALSFSIELPTNKVSETEYFFNDSYKFTYDTIYSIIYRAFTANPVWKRNELWEFVLNNPAIPLHLDKEIYEDMFDYIMSELVHDPKSVAPSINIINSRTKVFDSEFINGKKSKPREIIHRVVIHIDGVFILIPSTRGQIDVSVNSFLLKKEINYSNKYQIESDNTYKYKNHFEKVMKAYKESSDKNRLKYLFMLEFDEASTYMLLRDYLLGNIAIPKEIMEIYERLELVGSNWYCDRDKKYKLEDNEWNIYQHERNQRPENKIIVGIISDKSFKIRNPNSEKHLDLRLDSRGATCKTHKKTELKEIYDKLNLVIESSQISSICDDLFIKLVELECQSIISEDGLKYLYLYNE